MNIILALLSMTLLTLGSVFLIYGFESPWMMANHRLLAFIFLGATALVFVALLAKSWRNIKRLVEPYSADIERIAGQSLVHARRLVVLVTGCTLMLVGAAMLFLPGPGVVTIVLGLATLATEFIWARRILNRVKKQVKDAANSVLGKQDKAPK